MGKLQRRADPTDSRKPRTASSRPGVRRGDRRHRRRVPSPVASRWRRLNDRCQRLLRIVAFEERPDYARIAQDMAMPIGSIGPTRQRCLAKLRALLEGDGWGGDSDGD